jgi:FkbM family methyltransferase
MSAGTRETTPNSQLAVSREAVEWAYRLILGRPAESEAVLSGHQGHPSVAELRRQFIDSPEFNRGGSQHAVEGLPEALSREFPAWQGAAEADSIRDFLGVRTRCAYVSEPYTGPGGIVEGPPGARPSLHDPGEWVALLTAVVEARERFVLVELGAGWGPWTVAGARAAQQRGIRDITLVAVEADPGHIAFLRQHFRDNGLNPADHTILCAAAGAYDGKARFPKLEDSAAEWGAGAHFEGSAQADGFTVQPIREWIEVECISLPSLLAGTPPVDLIHFDIQGSELEVIRAGLAAMNSRVRRIAIGTHGRAIEAGLLEILAQAGWTLEIEKPCRISQTGTSWGLLRDGLQVWRNPRCQTSR